MVGRIRDLVYELADDIVEERGLELVDVEYKKEGSDWFLRVFIDHPEGIDHEQCRSVSEELSTLLDLEDFIDDSYFLEVSSPGVDRPLKRDEDFERFKGKVIEVSTYAPIQGRKKIAGTLLGLRDELIIVKVDGEEIEIPRNKAASVKLAVEF